MKKTYNVLDCGSNEVEPREASEPSGLELDLDDTPKSARNIRGSRVSYCLDPYVKPIRQRTEVRGPASSPTGIYDPSKMANIWVSALGGMVAVIVCGVLMSSFGGGLLAGIVVAVLLHYSVTVA